MDPLLREKVDRLPRAPGVYVMRGEGGEPLYVGKAAALRARVRSYFAAGSSDARFFVPLLSGLVRDIETVVTATASEALILENSLIKSLRPRYNVQLRDDKDYLSIRIDARAEWPRIDLVRRPRPDGARHFGPFGSARAARQAARAISRILRLRPCRDSAMRGRSRPCLQHQIGRCDAPCVGRADAEAYRAAARRAVALLDGRVEAVLAEMRAEMAAASEEMRYERAADLRDQIAAIERTGLAQPQRVVEVSKADRDVVGIHRDGSVAEVVVLEVRAGKLVACRSLGLRGVAAPDDEVIGAFLAERYASGAAVPDEVIVPAPVPDSDVLEAFLSEARGKRVRVIAPRRGRRAALAEMARVNAEQRFVEEARDREGAAAEAAALARALA
ncbi:MAG: excinuclease ABC subunit UvrC, partial [Myxococcota bacterium]|nr:excinuclease ABC subunit UvrC [Myxococcota bacterium]